MAENEKWMGISKETVKNVGKGLALVGVGMLGLSLII